MGQNVTLVTKYENWDKNGKCDIFDNHDKYDICDKIWQDITIVTKCYNCDMHDRCDKYDKHDKAWLYWQSVTYLTNIDRHKEVWHPR